MNMAIASLIALALAIVLGFVRGKLNVGNRGNRPCLYHRHCLTD